MEDSKWRGRARAFVYADMMFLSINVIELFLLFITSTAVTTNEPGLMDTVTDKSGASGNQVSTMFSLVAKLCWLTAAYLTVLTSLQSWADIKFLNSTDIGSQSSDAAQSARTSRNVIIAFLPFSFLEFYVAVWLGLITIIWRICFLVVLINFLQELNQIIIITSGSEDDTTYCVSSICDKRLQGRRKPRKLENRTMP